MPRSTSNDRLMDVHRAFHGKTLDDRLGRCDGIALIQLRDLSKFAGTRWRTSPCGTSRQPVELLDYVHQLLELRIYAPQANAAAGLASDGKDLSSAVVLRNLTADDIVVLADPKSTSGAQLLAGLLPPQPADATVDTAPSDIRSAAAADAHVALYVLFGRRREAA
jgi:hypothetical protein